MSSIEHSQIKRRTTDPTNKKIQNERGKYLMNLERTNINWFSLYEHMIDSDFHWYYSFARKTFLNLRILATAHDFFSLQVEVLTINTITTSLTTIWTFGLLKRNRWDKNRSWKTTKRSSGLIMIFNQTH